MSDPRARLWNIAKSWLFRMDAERVHERALLGLRLSGLFGSEPLRWMSGAESDRSLAKDICGTRFSSPVGLAAGFDKDASVVDRLPALGFGFVEIGTVTPRPQPGNPKPRLFRDSERQALFNCMGFNNHGAPAAAERLRRARKRLPADFRVGVNIGKNKTTPLERAHEDYAEAVRPFEGLADYLVINVSSPNTPGLRSLQTIDSLSPLVDGVCGVIQKWSLRPPLFLKLAPELSFSDLEEPVRHFEGAGTIQGWVLTNTLGGEYCLGTGQKLQGGWSGRPLAARSLEVLRFVRARSQGVLISVGGILSAEDAKERLLAGADLIQVYTGWIYGGPSFPAMIARASRMP